MNPLAAQLLRTGGEEDGCDRISDLPDDILLRIVGDLGLPAVVRSSGLSRRWRSVPHLLPDLTIDVADFVPRCQYDDELIMQAYAGAARRLLAPSAERALTLRSVSLRFLLSSEPHLLHVIGCAVEDMVAGEGSNMERLEFDIWTEAEIAGGGAAASVEHKAMFRRRLMSFLDACPVAFGWLTTLTLQNLCFAQADVARLLGSCTRMKELSLSHCSFGIAGCSSIVEIDVPQSWLEVLEIRFCCFRRVELIDAPKLRRFHCDTWYGNDPPVQFGHVPRLRNITLACNVHGSNKTFALSNFMSSAAAANLSTLDLDFRDGKIWIQPEEPIKLPFANLRDVYLYNIFDICHLNWTLFVLEAAPSLKNLYIMI
nr:unnamed protein product [Digitaria exilis]